jgi:thioredoxin-dependent peroxiredoxin
MIETGKPLPKSVRDMPLALSSGFTATIGDHAGHWLVLYFYPKDSTPGCTTEGNDFNRLLPKFAKLDATIWGVSRDSVKSHQNFCAKQGFRFDLVSDADEKLCNAFGVIKEKQLYGRPYIGVDRSTFLIGPDGRVVEAWRGVRVPGHAGIVLDALKAAAA